MIRLLAVFLMSVSMVSVTAAHHKPGHNPPGHQKHLKGHGKPRIVVPAAERPHWAPPIEVIIGLYGSTFHDVDDTTSDTVYLDWRPYSDTVYDFSIELPFALFEPALEGGRGLRLEQADEGLAKLDVYCAANTQGLATQDFVELLDHDDLIGEVTYREGGEDWFVLSGFYASERSADEAMIFYTKFMFSQDGERVSAFEISYPEADRVLFDAIVVRLEETLSAPT